MKLPLHILLALLACLSATVQSQINKCEIDDRIVYTDKACPGNSSRVLKIEPLNVVPATPPATGRTQSVTKPPEYKSNRWYSDHKGYWEALRVSRARKAPIFIYAYTDWCRYCKKFEESLLPKSIVKEALSGYVKIRINPEHGDEDKALFDRWRGNGYPALFVQSNPDSPPRKARGPFTQKKLMSARDFAILFRPEIGVTVVPIN